MIRCFPAADYMFKNQSEAGLAGFIILLRRKDDLCAPRAMDITP